jgi:type III secretory pathway component EscS
VGILISLFQSLVSIADAIVYGVIYFFLMIIILFAFATADGDDYWAEGGMPLPTESSVD